MTEIERVFFSTFEFDKQWKRMGLDDEDQRRLENEILVNPKIGAVIRGTGSLRKMRFAVEGKGKSGSTRILYVDFVVYERVYLIYAYPKGQKDNVSPEEREIFKKIIEQARKELGGRNNE